MQLTGVTVIENLGGMTASTWLNTDHQLAPGTEIFRADRCFELWQYTASHSQTLLRSPKGTDRLWPHL
jgi:hypothetical protein